jgi:hypothetical protein
MQLISVCAYLDLLVILDCCRVQELDNMNRDQIYMWILNLMNALFVDLFSPCNNCGLHAMYRELPVLWYIMHLLVTTISKQ